MTKSYYLFEAAEIMAVLERGDYVILPWVISKGTVKVLTRLYAVEIIYGRSYSVVEWKHYYE